MFTFLDFIFSTMCLDFQHFPARPRRLSVGPFASKFQRKLKNDFVPFCIPFEGVFRYSFIMLFICFFTFYPYVFLAFHCTVLLFADLSSTLCRHEIFWEPRSTYGKSQLSFQAFTIFLVSVLARPWKGPNCWGIYVQSLKSAGHSGKFAFKNSWQSVCVCENRLTDEKIWKAGKSLLPAVCFPSIYSAISSWGVAWCCSAPAWQHQTPQKRP